MATGRCTTILVLIALAGCGPNRPSTVRGEVTFDGAAVDGGTIVFIPTAGEGRKSAAAILEGKYEVLPEHLPGTGSFRVEINWAKKTGKMIPSTDPGITVPEFKEVLPKKYNETSTLTVELDTGENVRDFHLKSP